MNKKINTPSSISQIQKKAETPFFDHQSEQEQPFFASNESVGSEAFFSPTNPLSNSSHIQAKLEVGQPDDKYEQEADSVADKVVQRLSKSSTADDPSVADGKSDTTIQRKCAACEAEGENIQRKSSNTEGGTPSNIESQLNSSKGGGSPLPDNTRTSMESAMGADFSNVRVHTGSNAMQMSQDLNAQAFTHGSDVYFNAGKYNPSGTEGSHLLAHELTHTVQQGSINKKIQKQQISQTSIKEHGERSQMPAMACQNHFNANGTFNSPTGEQNVSHNPFFLQGLTSFASSQDAARLDGFISSWRQAGANASIELNGYASTEGAEAFNWQLSCDRAKIVKQYLINHGIPDSFINVFANGEVNKFSPNLEFNRRVTLISTVQIPPESAHPKCGPNATDWFIRTVNSATSDPRVLNIKNLLMRANATLALARVALNTDRLAETGSFAVIRAQLLRLGSGAPALNSTISNQLSRGAASARAVASETASANSIQTIAIGTATAIVGAAALLWKNLVDHGAPFDFKAHIMNDPRSAHCPDADCVSRETGVITLCPGSAPENCYESDITGNIFYALIGRFIGWSELTLQLGSQLAELTDTRTTPIHPRVDWDTPDDTFGINLGFSLPLPLTNAALCSAVGTNRSALSIKTGCADCTETFVP